MTKTVTQLPTAIFIPLPLALIGCDIILKIVMFFAWLKRSVFLFFIPLLKVVAADAAYCSMIRCMMITAVRYSCTAV